MLQHFLRGSCVFWLGNKQDSENAATLDVKRVQTVWACVTSAVFLVITVDLKDDYCYSRTLPLAIACSLTVSVSLPRSHFVSLELYLLYLN